MKIKQPSAQKIH